MKNNVVEYITVQQIAPLSAPDVICEAVLVIASLSVPFVSAHVSTAVRGAQCVDTNIYERLAVYSVHWNKTSAQTVFILYKKKIASFIKPFS